MVKMRHPKLPGQEIEVPDLGVGHHLRAGWRRVEPKNSRPSRREVAEKKDEPEGEQS